MFQGKFTKWAGVVVLAALPGCMLEKQDGGAEYRKAVPLREAMMVAGPETGNEGRPKTSSEGREYVPVLIGRCYGKRHEKHGEGDFTIHLDNARELDPFAHADDSGSVRIVHHVPRDITAGGLCASTPSATSTTARPRGSRTSW